MALLTFSLPGVWESVKSNISTVAVFVSIIIGVFLISYQAERIINKMDGKERRQDFKIHRMTIIAMLSAIAVILNLFDFPLWFVPSFYKIDFSELPALIGAFALGPIAGTTIEAIKILLNIIINGTTSAFIGEIANFVVGCAFVVPAAVVYYHNRTRKGAVIGMISGTVINLIVSVLMNAYVLLPVFAKLFFGAESIDPLIEMGTKVNSLITDLPTFCLLAVAPFNLLKALIVSAITVVIYKPISRVISSAR